MNIHVRQATATDLDSILILNREVQALHASLEPEHFRSDVDEGEVRAFFAGRLEKANHGIWLAESLGRPGGYVWFEKQEKAGTPFSPVRRRVYVHHIVVAADLRRHGVASTLLRCAEASAHGAGMQRIVLDSWAANVGALAFFDSEGFASLSMLLLKDLRNDGESRFRTSA
ncbi:GNAT family N-acetyltransferase [Lichenifustis flavocetrariae]|uniref:GNAT family N-acetyltransferase n=1 Tax=Lichenifustis flavocetrariae TaxID=2949735 RepID=A0AA41ZA32_9HYPH|nr:GNAT family N-acetyltransferase [Lichenifustis flavocetrariae]MCW6512072.1 GNAT family N-acetyltransferase [Lichenifustis flavocetrariae]